MFYECISCSRWCSFWVLVLHVVHFNGLFELANLDLLVSISSTCSGIGSFSKSVNIAEALLEVDCMNCFADSWSLWFELVFGESAIAIDVKDLPERFSLLLIDIFSLSSESDGTDSGKEEDSKFHLGKCEKIDKIFINYNF